MGKFEPGQSGNPGGRPKISEQERAVKAMTKETFDEMAVAMMTLTQDELERMIAGGIPFEAELFIRMMLKLAADGDWHTYQKYLDRRIGKVKDQVEHTGTLTLEQLVNASTKTDQEDQE